MIEYTPTHAPALTEEFCEPLRLVVVLDDSGHGVQEDEDDNQPEPPLLLTHPPHPELELLQSEHDSCNREQY